MKRSQAMWLTSAILAAIGLVIFCYIWFYARFYEYTDDAYVGGNMIFVTPQVPGIVTTITADDTDFIEEGRLLIDLDPTNQTIALSLACAELGEAVRTVEQLFQKVPELAAKIREKKALLLKAAQDFEHRQALIGDAAVSLEDLEHATANLTAAFAELIMTEHQHTAAIEEVDNTTLATHPLVIKAKEKLTQAYVDLERCQLLSPASGLVAQRKVQVGKQVAIGEPLLAVIPLEQMWITANFKETQLRHVRIGQKATVHVDLWGRQHPYQGRVIGIGGGTGSVFSVLPPQNATGNWIKIVQRIPVRIGFDPQDLKRYPLRLGLSCEVTIDIHHPSNEMIPEEKPEKALYETSSFSDQTEGVQDLIDKVIQDNISSIFMQEDGNG